MHRCAFDQNQLQVKHPSPTGRACRIKRDDGASLPPQGPLGSTQSPGRVCEEINRTRSAKATSFDEREQKKKTYTDGLLDKEQRRNIASTLFYLFFFKEKEDSSIFLGDLFNEMTSFLQDSVVNGFHTTLLATGGFGALAGKRAISATGVSAVFLAAI